jgi:hypothetical protein
MTGGKGRSIIRLVLLASALSLQIRWPVSRGSRPDLTDPFRQMVGGPKDATWQARAWGRPSPSSWGPEDLQISRGSVRVQMERLAAVILLGMLD